MDGFDVRWPGNDGDKRVDAVVVRCGEVAYVGFVIYWKCNVACRMVVRYEKIANVGPFMDGKYDSAWDDSMGYLRAICWRLRVHAVEVG